MDDIEKSELINIDTNLDSVQSHRSSVLQSRIHDSKFSNDQIQLNEEVISPQGVQEDNYQFMGVIEDIGGASQISVNSNNAADAARQKSDNGNPYKRMSKSKNSNADQKVIKDQTQMIKDKLEVLQFETQKQEVQQPPHDNNEYISNNFEPSMTNQGMNITQEQESASKHSSVIKSEYLRTGVANQRPPQIPKLQRNENSNHQNIGANQYQTHMAQTVQNPSMKLSGLMPSSYRSNQEYGNQNDLRMRKQQDNEICVQDNRQLGQRQFSHGNLRTSSRNAEYEQFSTHGARNSSKIQLHAYDSGVHEEMSTGRTMNPQHIQFIDHDDDYKQQEMALGLMTLGGYQDTRTSGQGTQRNLHDLLGMNDGNINDTNENGQNQIQYAVRLGQELGEDDLNTSLISQDDSLKYRERARIDQFNTIQNNDRENLRARGGPSVNEIRRSTSEAGSYGTLQPRASHGSILTLNRGTPDDLHKRVINSELKQSSHQRKESDRVQKYLSLELEHLHDLLSNKPEWFNIQSSIKQSFKYLLNISVQQQNQINNLTDSSDKIQILQSSLDSFSQDFVKKQSIFQLQQSIEKTVVELLNKQSKQSQRDHKDQNVQLAKNIQKAFNSQKDEIKELQKNCQNFQSQVLDSLDLVHTIKRSQDSTQGEANKKLTTVFREMERVQTQLLSKASYDDLQNIAKNTADKNYVKTQTNQFIAKADFEKLFSQKLSVIEDLQSQISSVRTNQSSEKREIRQEVLREVSQSMDEKLKKNRVDSHEFISDQIQQTQSRFDERIYGVDLKMQRWADDLKRFDEKQTTLETTQKQFQGLQHEFESCKRQISELERTELTKNNDILQSFIEQLKDFEVREANQIKINNQKFIDTQQQSANGSVDLQKQIVKLESDVRKEINARIQDALSKTEQVNQGFQESSRKNEEILAASDFQHQELLQMTNEIRSQVENCERDLTAAMQNLEKRQESFSQQLACDISANEVKEKADRGTLQNQIIKLLQQRKDDLELVTNAVQKQQQNTQKELERIKVDQQQNQIKHEMQILQKCRDSIINEDYKILESKIKNSPELREFVKVNEVQDALKKLSENFQQRLIDRDQQSKITALDQKVVLLQTAVDDKQRAFRSEIQEQFQNLKDDNLKVMLSQKFNSSTEVSKTKEESASSTQQLLQLQMDNLSDKYQNLLKDLALKPNMKDCLDLVDSKTLDMQELFTSINSTYDQFVAHKEAQNSLNSKLCANNCVARWMFRFSNQEQNEQVQTSTDEQGLLDIYRVKLSSTSVNACEENFSWTKQSFDEKGNLIPNNNFLQRIFVSMPGFYQVQIAMIFGSDNSLNHPEQVRIRVDSKVVEVIYLGSGRQTDKIKIFDASIDRQFCYKTDDEEQEAKDGEGEENEMPTRDIAFAQKASSTPRFIGSGAINTPKTGKTGTSGNNMFQFQNTVSRNSASSYQGPLQSLPLENSVLINTCIILSSSSEIDVHLAFANGGTQDLSGLQGYLQLKKM